MEDIFTELWPTLIMRQKFPAHEEHKQGLLAFIKDYMDENPASRQAFENRNLYESEYGIIPQFYDKIPGIKALADFFVESFVQISSKAMNNADIPFGEKRETIPVIRATWAFTRLKIVFIN